MERDSPQDSGVVLMQLAVGRTLLVDLLNVTPMYTSLSLD